MKIFNHLSDLWNAALPILADHVWQSTLFAIVAALLTLVLQKRSARIRYGVWLAASLKFLIPFSIFTAIGSRLSPKHVAALANPGLYVIDGVTQPFSQPLPRVHSAVITATKSMAPIHWESLVLAFWLCGFLTVLLIWIGRWWRISVARRNATTVTTGREVLSLRRLEHAAGIKTELPVLLSPTSLEPGVFGIFRPVLLWPCSISEHLDDPHLQAVLTHELCHVQRRDNLAAALHMLIEALFWFHPLLWWLGARMIEDRERACDETVIELGSQRRIYAESILRVCEFCLSSPLTCVSGVTGADLKKRMVHIMNDRMVLKLNFTRKLLLWTAACLALAIPIVYGLFNPTSGRAEADSMGAPRYTIVSIQPHPAETSEFPRAKMMLSLIDSNFKARGVSAETLIQLAYHVPDTQVVAAPDWLGSARFDIDAKVDKATADQMQKLTEDQRSALGGPMLQGLLADQFKLKVHQEARDLPVYELTIADGGSKLHKQADGRHGLMKFGMGELTSSGAPLDLLAAQLSMRLGRTVVDKTGLAGNYAYSLHWTPDADEQARMRHDEMIAPDTAATTSSAPPLLTAIQEQLGLTLQPQTDRVQVLVIDHIEQPE